METTALGRALLGLTLGTAAVLTPLACSGGDSHDASADGGDATDARGDAGSTHPAADGSSKDAPSDAAVSSDTSAASDAKLPATDGGFPAGWLYTSGGKIFVSDGTSGTPWMGRGVNVDDIFLCGYDNTLWMNAPEQPGVMPTAPKLVR